jgi:DNA-binding MurR/RpiR family transcriptional regulator
VASLAKRAQVSDPTVVRFVSKLGFDGFPAFQARLLEEVDAGLRSPLMMMESKSAQHVESVGQNYIGSVAGAMQDAMNTIQPWPFAKACDLIENTKGRIYVLGGRFSRHIAGMLAGYLLQIRSGVNDFGALTSESFDILPDIGRKDLLIIFDYRRYQRDVIRFAQTASARGAKIILFTDPWLSPIGKQAEVVIVGPVEANSPYDTMAPAVAQMEALVAELVSRNVDIMQQRVTALERVRSDIEVTIDTPMDVRPVAPASRNPRR